MHFRSDNPQPRGTLTCSAVSRWLMVGVCIAAVGFAAGCGESDTSRSAQINAILKHVQKLRGGTPDQRVAAARQLGEIGDPYAVDALVESLNDTQVRVRVAAVGALAAIGDRSAADALIDALKDESFQVRLAAAQALDEFNEPRAIEPLVLAVADEEMSVRLAAAETLGAFGASAVEPIASIYRNPPAGNSEQRRHEIKAAAVFSLGRTQSDKALPILLEAAGSSRVDIRLAAASALGRIRSNRAIDPLLDMLLEPLSEADRQRFEERRNRTIGDAERDAIVRTLKERYAQRILPYGSPYPQVIRGQEAKINEAADRLRSLIEEPINTGKLDEILVARMGRPQFEKLSASDRDLNRRQLISLIDQATHREMVRGERELLTGRQIEQVQKLSRALATHQWWTGLKADKIDEMIRNEVAAPVDKEEAAAELNLRTAAADALAALNSPEAARALLDVLGRQRRRGIVSTLADQALRQMGAAAVEPLKAFIIAPDRHSALRRHALEILIANESAEAAEALVGLTRFEGDAAVRSQAARAVEDSSDPRLVEPMLRAAKSEDANVRRMAVQVLGRIGDKRARDVMLDGLRDDSPLVREAATRWITNFEAKRAVPLLLRILDEEKPYTGDDRTLQREDRAPQILRNTMQALAKFEVDKAKPKVRRFLDHDNVELVKAAIAAAGQLRDREAVPRLIEIVNEGSWAISRFAMGYLGMIGDPRAVPVLVQRSEKKYHSQEIAVTALGKIIDPSATEALIALLKTRDMETKKLAARALVQHGELAVKPLESMLLEGDDKTHRAFAAEILGQLDVLGVPSLTKAVRSDQVELVKLGLYGLGEIRDEQAVRQATPVVAECLNHADPQVRAGACWALGHYPDSAAIAALEALLPREQDDRVIAAAKQARNRIDTLIEEAERRARKRERVEEAR